jgi:CMP-N,N'-diacetyllegionaminic acid synthase
VYNGQRVVCIIPARGGSKGLPRKNILEICRKPLIAYSIEQAKGSKYIDRTIVSTEDEEIAKISESYGAEVPFMRPDDLAADTTSTIDVLLHAITWLEENAYEFDVLVLLHVTAPLRTISDIDNSIAMLFDENADNIFSATPSYRNPYFNMVEEDKGKISLVKKGDYATRQSAPKVYDLNASIYVWRKEVLKEKKSVFLDNSRVYVMPKERSVDIDDEVDFKLVRLLMEEQRGGLPC